MAGRHAQHVARGSNAARQGQRSGQQDLKFSLF